MGFFSSVTSGLKKAARAVGSAIGQAVSAAKTILNRVVGLIDFGLGLIGFLPAKKLRLRIVILHDESNSALTTPNGVTSTLDFAKLIFKSQANVNIIAAGGVFIETLGHAAPTAALEVGCGFDAWKEELGEAGDLFGRRTARNMSGILTGYAAPVTAFIVRDVRGVKGCSLGPLTDYVTLGLDGLSNPSGGDDVSSPSKWLAHEIAHACGLWHGSYGNSNLINPDEGSGIELTRFQRNLLRNSRHVTYL